MTGCGIPARRNNALEHDPEKWKPFSEKIMLKREDAIMMRFLQIAS
jgi:hypothetical protein